MTRQQRRTIEREFYRYKENRDKAARYVADSAFNGFGTDLSEPCVKSSSGNGIESRVIDLISEEERAWRWCIVFQRTLDRFRFEPEYNIMVALYIEHRRRMEILTSALWETTFYRWRERWLRYALQWAKEFNLL